MEFNMENVVRKEQETRDGKERLAEKVARTIETLQGSVEILESNLDVDGAEDAPEDS